MERPYASKAEAAIAGMFTHHGIGFRYEYPIAVLDRGRTRLWYPDVWVPEHGVIIEYNGMPENAECRARQEHKKLVYAEVGLPALFLEPTDLRGYWAGNVLDWMEATQRSRLSRLRHARSYGRQF